MNVERQDVMLSGRSAQFPPGTPEEASRSIALSQALRRFLDAAAAMKPNEELFSSLTSELECWSERLEAGAASEDESVWRKAHRDQPPALLPQLSFNEDGEKLEGSVTFGRFHVGRGAAHGGAISLVFDEVMGALAGSRGRTRTRTAFLHVDFRAVTPIDTALRIRAWFEAEIGRKRLLRAILSDGEVVCAEAHGLWLELKLGQP